MQKLPEMFAQLLKGREPRQMKIREANAGEDRLFVTEVLVKGDAETYLEHGWKLFAHSYGLSMGDILFLTYDGVNTLTVKVFKPTMCRKQYPCINTADPDTVLDNFCVLPKGVSLDDRQKTFVKDLCVQIKPKIPFYICKIVQSHIDKAKGKMVSHVTCILFVPESDYARVFLTVLLFFLQYFNQEYTKIHISGLLSKAGDIDLEIYGSSSEKIGDFSMKVGESKKASITHKWLSVPKGQEWEVGDIVMFKFRRHSKNSLRLDVQKI